MAKSDYIQTNKSWLADISKQEGVNPLSKCVYYKVLAEGDKDGAKPRPSNIITAHYTGRTINGNIPFHFKQTGAHFYKDGKLYNIPRNQQMAQANKAGIDFKL